MDLTPKQQTSEAVRQAETILITTGQHPSVDQVAAVIGLSMILRKFGKKVSAIISDTLPQSVQLLDTATLDRSPSGLRDFVLKVDVSKAEVEKLRYEVIDSKLNIFVTPYKGNFAPSDVTFDYGEAQFDYDMAIILGVPTRARIDRIYEQNASMFERSPVVNLDFHRSNENYGAVNLIEPNASSLCEMLVALAESLQGGIIDADIATALLMGIVASTDRFTASHTTSKSLTVAAQMMAAGARQQAVVRALYKDGKGQNDRGGERADRGDRSGSRGGERQDRAQGGQREAQPQRETQNQRSQQPAHEPRPERQTANESRAERQPAAAEQQRNERREADLPIIQPSHIEMSEAPEERQAQSQPQAQPQAAPESQQTATTAAAEALSQPAASNPAPTPTPAPAPNPAPAEQPPINLPPLADFAAAAEILAKRQNDDQQKEQPE